MRIWLTFGSSAFLDFPREWSCACSGAFLTLGLRITPNHRRLDEKTFSIVNVSTVDRRRNATVIKHELSRSAVPFARICRIEGTRNAETFASALKSFNSRAHLVSDREISDCVSNTDLIYLLVCCSNFLLFFYSFSFSFRLPARRKVSENTIDFTRLKAKSTDYKNYVWLWFLSLKL